MLFYSLYNRTGATLSTPTHHGLNRRKGSFKNRLYTTIPQIAHPPLNFRIASHRFGVSPKPHPLNLPSYPDVNANPATHLSLMPTGIPQVCLKVLKLIVLRSAWLRSLRPVDPSGVRRS